MTITLDLPNELERELEQAAARAGLPLEEYALQVLAANHVPAAGPAPRTGADLVAFWEREGLIGSRPDIEDSARHARELRERAQRRHGT